MKRQPTEVVALVVHALTVMVSALMWLHSNRVELLFRDFGAVLPAPTQLLYEYKLPAVIFVLLVGSFVAAIVIRGVVVSSVAIVGGVVTLVLLWAALRLPFLPL